MSTTRAGPGRPGRPRDPTLDRRILRHAVRVLSERGYEGFNMDAVAAASRCAKPAIYRRWPTKDDLVLDALASSMPDFALAPSRDPRRDLTRLIERLHGWNQIAILGLVPRLIGGGSRLMAAFRARIVAPRDAEVARVLGRARAARLIRSDLNEQVALDLLLGPPFLAAVMRAHGVSRPGSSKRWASALVALLLDGIGTGKRHARRHLREPRPRTRPHAER